MAPHPNPKPERVEGKRSSGKPKPAPGNETKTCPLFLRHLDIGSANANSDSLFDRIHVENDSGALAISKQSMPPSKRTPYDVGNPPGAQVNVEPLGVLLAPRYGGAQYAQPEPIHGLTGSGTDAQQSR